MSESDVTTDDLDDPSISSVETNDDTVLSNNSTVTPNSSGEAYPSLDTESQNSNITFMSKGLHFCNLNIRHLTPKLDELQLVMATDNGPDIFGICETFLEYSVPDCQLNIQGFEFMRKDRSDTQDKSGGGLVLYYRNSLNSTRRRELEISNIETLWSEFNLPNTRPFLVCTVYRPPDAKAEWIDSFEKEVSIAQATGLEIIMMGDFNIDYNKSISKKWLNMIQIFDLSQLVSEPTRITEKSATIIDHVYTNHPENVTECFISKLAISDHSPVCFTRKVNCKIPKNEHVTTTYRCFKKFNESAFLSDLQNDLDLFTANATCVDDDFSNWSNLIITRLDNHAPIKTLRVKHRRLPEWFSPDITHMQRLRDDSKRKKNWSDFKRYRNKTRQLIRAAKRKYFSDSISDSKDSKFLWRHLRAVSGNKRVSSSDLPDELIINNETFTGSENIATKLNEYFTSIADILNGNQTESAYPDFDRLQHFTNSKLPENTFFHIPLITSDQVLSYINKLDSSKATGIDGLGPRIIKLAANVLAPSIAILVNKSIKTGKFPTQLKTAKVFPIYKGGTKSDPSNYRPISILPTVSKIYEKHINHHLMGYLNKFKSLHESQSGFRQKHSCQTALVKLIDQWKACIDNGDIVGTLFIDFRKAFDVVDHRILIQKLHVYKFSTNAIRWFESYLECRQQAIISDKGLSKYANVRPGVPQGSILGPTLFLLFINDLPLVLKFCEADLYADDAIFHTHDKDKATIQFKVQSDFNESKQWSKCNKMHMHDTKTSCMTVGTSKRLDGSHHLDIKAGDVSIKHVTSQKHLGVYIDENLNWGSHVEYICKIISSKISLLQKLSEYVPIHVQKQFYQSYILPLIDYGSITWGSTSTANLGRLLKLQKRAARIILKSDFDTSSASMFQELGWMPVESRINYNKAVLTYKALNNMTPDYITKLLTPMSQAHSRNLRSSENNELYVPFSQTKLYSGAFSCSAPRLWNSFPQAVRNAESLNVFKRNVKPWC